MSACMWIYRCGNKTYKDLIEHNKKQDETGEIKYNLDAICLAPNYEMKYTRSKRYKRYFTEMKKKYAKFIDRTRDEYNTESQFLVCDVMLYDQGWFFKKPILGYGNKHMPVYFAFTKKDVDKLLDKCIDRSTDRGIEAYKNFKNFDFNDETDILEISW